MPARSLPLQRQFTWYFKLFWSYLCVDINVAHPYLEFKKCSYTKMAPNNPAFIFKKSLFFAFSSGVCMHIKVDSFDQIPKLAAAHSWILMNTFIESTMPSHSSGSINQTHWSCMRILISTLNYTLQTARQKTAKTSKILHRSCTEAATVITDEGDL